jgi:hypothetical protein
VPCDIEQENAGYPPPDGLLPISPHMVARTWSPALKGVRH